jgi:hypothetical protein
MLSETIWNSFEDEVLQFILTGDSLPLNILRAQLGSVTNRERTFNSAGFFTKFTLGGTPQLIGGSLMSFAISDVVAKMPDLEFGAGFILFISNGRLDTLEGYTFQEPWPNRLIINNLSYMEEPREERWL